jgi:hypothetical protein
VVVIFETGQYPGVDLGLVVELGIAPDRSGMGARTGLGAKEDCTP